MSPLRAAVTDRLALVVWLAAVWVLLWGSVAPLVLLSAAVAAPLCLAACRLPPLPGRARPRLRRWPGVLGRFAVDVVVSTAQVAWTTLRRGPRTRSAVVAVQVGSPSDTALTLVANRLSLVPGTLVVDMDRDAGKLYVYVFDVRGPKDLENGRRDAERNAAELLHALGEDRPGGEGGRRA